MEPAPALNIDHVQRHIKHNLIAFGAVVLLLRFFARKIGIEVLWLILIEFLSVLFALYLAFLVDRKRKFWKVDLGGRPHQRRIIASWCKIEPILTSFMAATAFLILAEAYFQKVIFPVDPKPEWLRQCSDVRSGQDRVIAIYTCTYAYGDALDRQNFTKRFSDQVCRNPVLRADMLAGSIVEFNFNTTHKNSFEFQLNSKSCGLGKAAAQVDSDMPLGPAWH